MTPYKSPSRTIKIVAWISIARHFNREESERKFAKRAASGNEIKWTDEHLMVIITEFIHNKLKLGFQQS